MKAFGFILLFVILVGVFSTSCIAQPPIADAALAVKETKLLKMAGAAEYALEKAAMDRVFDGIEMDGFISLVRDFQEEKEEADTTLALLYGAQYRTTTEINPDFIRIADKYESPFIEHRDKDGTIRTILSGYFNADVRVLEYVMISNFFLMVLFVLVALFFLLLALNSYSFDDTLGFIALCMMTLGAGTIIFLLNGGW